MARQSLCILCLFAGLPVFAAAESPPNKETEASLTRLLQALLRDSVPPVLYEGQQNWGKQAMVSELRFKGVKPVVEKVSRNDGTWRKYKVTPRNLPSTFKVELSDLKKIDADKQTFKIYLTFMVNVEMDQQNWESGTRLYAGSVKARLRLHLGLDFESTLKLDTSKATLLPDAIFRLRVTKANLWYNELVVEHLGGVGGTTAKVVGDVVHDAVKQWRPSLERNLQEKANAAIVKAADTKEIKLSFGSWLGGK